MTFQTRSDNASGKHPGLDYFSTFEGAYKAWQEDKNIWKISFCDKRFRPKYKSEKWEAITEQKLCTLNSAYNNTSSKDATVFWVEQKVMPDNVVDLNKRLKAKEISQKQFDTLYNLGCIVAVLTDDQFKDLGRNFK